ncbi:MAG: hypothetical protein GXY17_00335 [Clostridiaceae bacterium]|nr:hypothetical protein [Clostridiaceae bacterium]
MRRMLLILFIIAVFLTGCSSNSPVTDGSDEAFDESSEQVLPEQFQEDDVVLKEEISFYPAFNENYKTGNNSLFDFWFDIPVEWNVVDNSQDASTYDILSGNDKVIIQISGVLIDESNQDEDKFCDGLAGKNGTVSEYRFQDRWVGKHIQVSDNVAYYLRVDGDSYLILYMNTEKDPQWRARNEEILNNIAQSVRTAKQSHGINDTANETITQDDLQLGDIWVGMTYEELIEAMDKEPEDIAKEEYEGFVTKTLFFDDGTQVYIVDDTVYTINVTSPAYETPRGLKTGDSKQRLVQLYGKPSNEADGIAGYTHKGYEVFIVVIEDDKLMQIQIELGTQDIEIY